MVDTGNPFADQYLSDAIDEPTEGRSQASPFPLLPFTRVFTKDGSKCRRPAHVICFLVVVVREAKAQKS